jgi:hypothetical protein
MQLLTKAILVDFAKTGSQEHVEDPRIIVKYFGGASYTFYATEYNPETKIFFGYVTGLHEDEYGYVSLDDLKGARFQFGLGIERDLYFGNDKHISDIK